MKKEILLSAGIDIGTTTTHLIISKIGIELTDGFGIVPKAKIASKEIVYKSPVYLTPLAKNDNIDARAVAKIIAEEYEKAGVTPDDLKSGAVIITGESACKGNAAYVLEEISRLAGDFVAAQAGSELESYLAAKGAGADKISEDTGKAVVNIDVGGGTSNIAVFENGKCIDSCCLNIGGRMIRQNGGKISFAKSAKRLLSHLDLKIDDLEKDKEKLKTLCTLLSEYIFSAIGLNDKDIPQYLITDKSLKIKDIPEIFTFSGGVAQCMNGAVNDFAYGDIGVLLARAIKDTAEDYKLNIIAGENPIRATVIGAGQYSMEVSGSTIKYSHVSLPMKNLPCVCSLEDIKSVPCAVCPTTRRAPSFSEIDELAKSIVDFSVGLIDKNIPIVVITREDCSKALGQCLKIKLPKDYPFLCADGIECKTGDYIDIGRPLANGTAVPVIVKTLVFGG